jgi:hypothetical protein
MITRSSCFLLILVFAAPLLSSQNNIESKLNEVLGKFLSCETPIDDSSPCNRFVSRALNDAYGIDDFKHPTKKDEYLLANEIAAYVATSPKWVFIGNASEQDVLDAAVKYAQQRRAVIAVKSAQGSGHVAIVLPGQQTLSATWKLRVPRSASFFLGRPKESFVGEPLSKVWQSPAEVKLYAREFSRNER